MAMMFINVGCNSFSGEEGTEIIDAKEALDLFNQENVVVVDAQGAQGYESKHVKNSVNITRADIVINEPVANMLAPKEQIEEVMSKRGISNDDTVVIYDNNNNMDSARLWWTLKVYGHENIKVVSGGLNALRDANVEFTEEMPNVSPTKYVAKDKDTTMIATKEEVKSQVNDPKKNVMLIDTRTQKEYDAGTIPGSVLMNYIDNNEFNGTFKSVSDIQVRYLDEGLIPEDTAIMYCKTSIRGTQTYLALYNAGYRNLKLYDGAWVEWSKDSSLPVQMPEKTKIEINEQDIS
ncbi:MAG: sulfurtransferase [Firmicutes bacterium]|nr:sulfurtransferase [Bacillota bacterium]